MEGTEGPFTIASFWLVEALTWPGGAGRPKTLRGPAGLGADLGIFAEEIDPRTGAQLGNTPQAFRHVGLINAALRLAGTSAKGGKASAPAAAKD
ncbi:glycoside hydrolase family 15 protein [Pseudarthrobacter raffinosi]|uniref:glycoside hydrolase family 15 protein n=1 Tax=Pseudarthrobacter raffinosi TaxID=2953651 RepID=UPI00208E4946|nr:glycoside hydrolase family 15 protein [Pseudarthrobacter sp. MDT3-28]MCO4239196.1 hypothetical protein [Pseudarthrobacter sp. MDT3-28]